MMARSIAAIVISAGNLNHGCIGAWQSVVWLCWAVLKSGTNMAFVFEAVAHTEPPSFSKALHPLESTAALHLG